MATQTPFLNLVLPGFEEFTDSWNEVLNSNFSLIDTAVSAVTTEVVTARGSTVSLSAFLLVGHNSDGTLQAAPEVIRARVSPVYGFEDSDGNALPLSSRLTSSDYEIFNARRGQPTLLDSQAFSRSGLKDMILQGAANANGSPSWIGSTSASVNVDGSATLLYLLIGGYTARVRTLASVAITGAAATYYIAATYQSGGLTTVDGSTTAVGQTSVDTDGNMTIFTDSTVNFTASNVQVGDILTLSSTGDAGKYVVMTVAPAGVQTQLQIIGTFPVGGLSSIAYTVQDPLGVTLSSVPTSAKVAGQLIIGEADFDGTAVTAVRPRMFKDAYNSPWVAYNTATATSGIQETVFNHYLGDDILDVEVQVSQVNDGSMTVEALSLSDLQQNATITVTDGKGVAVANTLTFNPSTSGATLTGGPVDLAQAVTASLTGTITATSGPVTAVRSAAVKWDRNNLYVKNVTPYLFYKDYSGVQHQTGYLRVVVRKRG